MYNEDYTPMVCDACCSTLTRTGCVRPWRHNAMTDEPKPLDTAPVTLPDDLLPLTEFLAQHTDDVSTRQAALETLKLLAAHGYRIVAPSEPAPPPAIPSAE